MSFFSHTSALIYKKIPSIFILRKQTLAMKLDKNNRIRVIDDDAKIIDVMRNITESGVQEDAFYIFDADDLIKKYKNWKQKLPRIYPYYAVKSNDNTMVLKILAHFGLGFDCASKFEISKVLSLGIEPSRIIYANPTKQASHLQYASDCGVQKMTFDNENELHKIKHLYPSAKIILRIRSDASLAQTYLGTKFGCDAIKEAPKLLRLARSLNLDLIGICFHVGSGCREPDAYRRAISASRRCFELGQDLGFNMRTLDIGGGFPGDKSTSFDETANVINKALDEYFPVQSGVNIIAEPGRYFVASAFSMAAMVHSKRQVIDPASEKITSNMYYINDGALGSFADIIYDSNTVTPIPLSKTSSSETSSCSIWGPTCDSIDLLIQDIQFPVLDIGDWIMFENRGAYTFVMAMTFNGFPIPETYTVVTKTTMSLLKNIFE